MGLHHKVIERLTILYGETVGQGDYMGKYNYSRNMIGYPIERTEADSNPDTMFIIEPSVGNFQWLPESPPYSRVSK